MAQQDDPLTEAELTVMERRALAASRGPWTSFVEGRDHMSGDSFIRLGDGEDLYLTGGTLADQDFVACARQDLPRLIAEVRRLRQLLGRRHADASTSEGKSGDHQSSGSGSGRTVQSNETERPRRT
ncbi:hypothetical protein [Deinococcus pimensis]|uniref:hypothetical protein n=1 Tax=Deinococcus pimensis TaxID=309888 RepID=UPI0004B2C31B|nr:hypothetical protein [Deinococcus pimensis]